jgi:hypothetical protein
MANDASSALAMMIREATRGRAARTRRAIERVSASPLSPCRSVVL